MTPTEPRPKGGLARTALLGSGAQIVGRGLRALVGVVTVAVLSRFLSPDEFGAFALVFFITMFAQLFADFGLRIALVQRPHVSPIDLDSVFWASIVTGMVLAAAMYLGADAIAALFSQPEVAPYVRQTSVLFLLAGMGGVPLALLERSFRFQTIATAEVVSAVAGAAVAIGLAVAGFSVLALVAQQVMVTAVLVLMNGLAARWVPRFRFSFESLRPMLAYGTWGTLGAAVQYLSGNIDRPLVGSQLSTRDLGYLAIAQQIVQSPIRTISVNIRRVTFPILSSIQDDNARIGEAHSDTLHAMMLVLAPVCLGLSAVSIPATAVLLGAGWEPVAALIGISAVTALIASVGDVNAAIFGSKGKARFLFGWSVFSLAGNTAALLLAVPHGIVAIAWARLAMMLVQMPLHSWFLGRLLGRPLMTTLMPMARPLVAAGLMALGVGLFDHWLGVVGMAPLPRLVLGVGLGVPLYGGLILLVDRERVLKLKARVLKLRR